MEPAPRHARILDPICGTANFAFGSPLFCTNIFLMREGEPVLAVVAEGLRNEIAYAVRGQGAFLRTAGGATIAAARAPHAEHPGQLRQRLRAVGASHGVHRSTAARAGAAQSLHTPRDGHERTFPMQARGVLAGNIFEAARPWDSTLARCSVKKPATW